MKIRTGFVSNSSSASFVIKKDNLTNEQVDKILNYYEETSKLSKKEQERFDYIDKFWEIEDDECEIKGYTFMDNFNMEEYLDYIGVLEGDIEWYKY